MDLKNLAQKLDRDLSVSATLKPFGRTEQLMLEVQPGDLAKTASWIRSEESARMDFLENFSCHEFRSKLVFTYFLRSQVHGKTLIIRTETPVPEGERLSVPSVSRVWPMVQPFEDEIHRLFGVDFAPHRGPYADSLVFPLRKSYVWEAEVMQ